MTKEYCAIDRGYHLISEEKLLQLAEKVVMRYVFSGSIPMRESEDVKMSVVERFWENQSKIAATYTGKAKITTYCIAVLNRMCCEVIRKSIMQWNYKSEEYVKGGSSSDLSSSERLVIKDEVRLLDKIIRMFSGESAKINVFFSYYFQLEPNINFLKSYFAGYQEKHLQELLDPDDIVSKSQLFDTLARVSFLCENKNVKADAVRMWLNKKMDKIIERLNGPFKRANYDRESLHTLFEYYYISKKG